jgi:tetratricopeptide (TPR) repeat protein
MNAAIVMQTCPNEETLAAFVDGRLNEQARLQVTEHLVDCGDCRDIVMTASDYGVGAGEAEPAPKAELVRGRFVKSVLVPLVAAAAIAALLFGIPSIRERLLGKSGMEALVEAANSLPERTTDARLSGNFAYRDYRPTRGGGEDPPIGDQQKGEYLVLIAASRIAERAERNASPKNLHELGVAHILINDEDKDAAVQALERAASTSPVSGDVLTDLAAAYLTRGKKGDPQRAYDAATKAWTMKQTPAAAWNRALALETLERNQEAIDAWRKYLALDPASEWSKEAAKNIDTLQSSPTPPDTTP